MSPEGSRSAHRTARGIAGKLLGLVVTLLVTSFLVFFSLYLAPGDPINFLVQGRSPSPEAIAAIEDYYGLDEPLVVQYLTWLGNALQGDFGVSLVYREDVGTLIGARLPTSMSMVALSTAIILVTGLAAGITGALTAGRFADRAVLVGVTILAAIPAFAAAVMLTSLFAVRLGVFPTFGSGSGAVDRLYHLTLPSVALALTFIALVARVTRSSMLEELGREHVEVALSRGGSRPAVVRRHVMRNAAGPILTISGLLVAGLLVSSSIVETAFGLDGVGSLLVSSVDRGDFPVVQALVLLVVTTFVVINFLVDLVYPLLDPRLSGWEAAR